MTDPGKVGAGHGGPAFDAIVLGAGISGLVSASVLTGQGCVRVPVVEEYPNIGDHLDAHIGTARSTSAALSSRTTPRCSANFPELMPRYVPVDAT